MKITKVVALSILVTGFLTPAWAEAPRWTEAQAQQWQGRQPWLIGSNYTPRTAINQLEMWQADTFDPATIDQELGWAESLGMNTMRVFLHDLLWQQDAAGFQKRLDQFLGLAAKHKIKPLLVLFDSCWEPNPKLGPQHPPIPGVHNSGWVQSPGAAAIQDKAQHPRLKAYVQGVLKAFGKDDRVLGWDVWNEPDNGNVGSHDDQELKDKAARIQDLLVQVFTWAREAQPSQPLTSGVWDGGIKDPLTPMQKLQLEQSDVISFHNYGWPEEFKREVEFLKRYHRPILCTEFMARPMGSTFDGILPYAKAQNVGAINWGFVEGKTQTYLPWESWTHPYVRTQPPVWFHEVFRKDGTPYRAAEVELIRSLTGKSVEPRS